MSSSYNKDVGLGALFAEQGTVIVFTALSCWLKDGCFCDHDQYILYCLQVLHQGHKPKRQREFQIGLSVLHDRSQSAARVAIDLTALTLQRGRPQTSLGCSRAGSAPPSCLQTPAGRCGTARPSTAARTGAESTRVWAQDNCMMADSGISSSREVVLRFNVEQGQTYTLVPYTRWDITRCCRSAAFSRQPLDPPLTLLLMLHKL